MALLLPTCGAGAACRRCRAELQVNFRQPDLACVLARNPDIGRHGDFQPAANAVTIDCPRSPAWRVLRRSSIHGVQTEVILKSGIRRWKAS